MSGSNSSTSTCCKNFPAGGKIFRKKFPQSSLTSKSQKAQMQIDSRPPQWFTQDNRSTKGRWPCREMDWKKNERCEAVAALHFFQKNVLVQIAHLTDIDLPRP